MFTSAVRSLLWKEYRVQRTLWLCLLGLLLLTQVILRLEFFSSGGSGSSYAVTNDEAWATWAMWFSAYLCQVTFIVASAAICFAGEREERTVDMIVQHAPSPWAVLLVKVGTCLGGSLMLYLIGTIVALALGRASRYESFPAYQFFLVEGSVWGDIVVRTGIALVVFVWCVFGSLISQRVLTSVPAMAIGWVVTGWIPVALFTLVIDCVPADILPFHQERNVAAGVFAFITAGMIVVDVWLGYRWVHGDYLDFNFPSEYRDYIASAWRDVLDPSSRPSRIPTTIEPDEVELRPWLRLVWQERNRNVITRWLTFVACGLLMVVWNFREWNTDSNNDVRMPDIAVCLMALGMGVLSFRNDGEGQPVRFLANHGASAAMVWQAKQAVWMVRAFVTCVVIALVALRDSRMFFFPLSLIERLLWLIVLSYGYGQLAAMVMRRAILAAITGAVAVGVFLLWFELMRNLRVPQWWSLGIQAAAPLLATRMYARAWLMDNGTWTWTQQFRLFGVLFGLPIVTCGIVAFHRANEVSWRPHPNIHLIHDVAGNLPAVGTNEESTARQRLLAIGEKIHRSSSSLMPLSPEERSLADELAGISISSLHLAIDRPNHLFPETTFQKLSDLLLARAQDHLVANEPQLAFDKCLANVRFCIAMARGPFNPCWQASAEQERKVLEMLVTWANHERVNYVDLYDAIREVEWTSVFPSIGASIVDELEEAKHRSIIDQYVELHGGIVGWQRIWLQLPWETARRHQLWELQASMHRLNLERLVRGPVVTVGNDYLQPIKDLQETTWGAEVALTQDRNFAVLDHDTAKNAALTRMGIIAYRKQNGTMPPDLDALFGIVRQSNLLDPWSSGRFDYRTNFLVSQGNSQSATNGRSKDQTGEVLREPSLKASRYVFAIPPASVKRNEELPKRVDQKSMQSLNASPKGSTSSNQERGRGQ